YRSRPNLIGCGPPIRTAPDLGGVFSATVQVPRDIGAQGAVRLEPELAVGAQAVRGDMSDGQSEARGAGGGGTDGRSGVGDTGVSLRVTVVRSGAEHVEASR